MITTVFIDIDNTLLDFDLSARQAMSAALKEYGVSYRDDMFPTFKKINDDLWRRIEDGSLTKNGLRKIRWLTVFAALGIGGIDAEEFEDKFHDLLAVSAAPVDGAVELLEYLCKKYTLCAASNGPFKQQRFRLKKAGMLKYFKHVFVSEKAGAMKPTKEFFDYCTSRLAVSSPDEIVLIGDSLTADINGGKNYNMKTIWFDFARLNIADGEWDYAVKELSEIKNIL